MAVIESGMLKAKPFGKGGISSIMRVDFKCGHSMDMEVHGVVQIDLTDSVKKVEKTSVCVNCFKDSQKAKVKKAGLPQLEGVSEKQVEYAESIRLKTVKHVDAYIKDYKKRKPYFDTSVMEADREVMVAITSAKFWLDNRGMYALEVAGKGLA